MNTISIIVPNTLKPELSQFLKTHDIEWKIVNGEKNRKNLIINNSISINDYYELISLLKEEAPNSVSDIPILSTYFPPEAINDEDDKSLYVFISIKDYINHCIMSHKDISTALRALQLIQTHTINEIYSCLPSIKDLPIQPVAYKQYIPELLDSEKFMSFVFKVDTPFPTKEIIKDFILKLNKF